MSDDKTNSTADVFQIFKKIPLNKKFKEGSGMTLPNNEIKVLVKVIKSLKNKGILLKLKKLLVKKEGFLIFLNH